MDSELINTESALAVLLDQIVDIQSEQPYLYLDLEGNNLSRHGTLSLVTILVKPLGKVYLVDVTALGNSAFTTQGANGSSLQKILESPDIIKVFFDIRNDSDALYSLHGVRVEGIHDLQLMELASRHFSKKYVSGLARCIVRDSNLGFPETEEWVDIKEKGKRIFNQDYAAFDKRPIDPDLLRYCVQDVAFMPHLYDIYRARIYEGWLPDIWDETKRRVELSQTEGYNGQGQHMALGPSRWLDEGLFVWPAKVLEGEDDPYDY
ncbi:3'-5' exonuclease-like protein 2 [Elsinoe australis]|uniref:3'-5' exonuclease-like protein 2 n=1 Tax=Elsinoe australis TaxID=40998 RepID=A0A4U7B3F9_9PEZI|nr:3'-5' exonuclease-like protein 2 [Elsinoe australis]